MKTHKNRFFAISAASVALTMTAFAADGTWSTTTSGALWTLDTNWTGNVIADGSGFTADFSQVNIAGATTVNLNGNRTIGNLIFGDTNTGSAGSWILAGGSDVLTLAGATPTITVNALASLGDYGANATISAGLAGTSGLTKVGAGRLILSGGTANTFSGPITVNAGMLGSLNSASLRNVAGAITVASGATFDAKAGFGANITNNFTLSGTGSGTSNYGTVYGALNIRENANLTGAITLVADTLITHDWNVATVSGSITGTNTNLELKTLQAGQFGFFLNGAISLGTGSLTLTGVGTSGSPDFTLSGAKSYTGGTLLKGGRVSFNNASALGNGAVTFVSDTSLASTASMTHANALTVNSGVAATLDVAASTTFDQSGAVTGAGSFTKSGLGTATLSGGTSNTLSGPLTVNAGILGSLNSASLQNVTGVITVASGATFDAKASFGADIVNNFTLSGPGSGINNYGALNIRENANLTGAITLAADTRITHDWNIATISGSITGTNTNLELQTLQAGQFGFYMNGPISLGTGSLTLTGIGTAGSPDFTLTGAKSYTGGTLLKGGRVSINNASSLGSGTVTFVSDTSLASIASMTHTNPLMVSSGVVATLDVAASTTFVQSGALAGNGALTKSGTGTLNLSGSSTYTGATQVNAGKLFIGSSGSLASIAVTVGGSTAAGTPTLGGGGTIGGATVIAAAGGGAAGTHAPGVAGVASGVGTQTFSSTLTYGSGSIFEWDLNAGTTDPGVATVNSGTYDQVVAGGSVSGTSIFQIVLGGNTFSSDFWNTNKSWNNVFTGAGVTTGTLQALFTTFSGAGVDSSGFVTGRGQFAFTSGNSLAWSAVPEPTSAMAGLLIAAGFLRRRRK